MTHRKLIHSLSINSAAILSAAGLHSRTCKCEEKNSTDTESNRFKVALAHHQSQIDVYRRQWEYSPNSNATTSTKTPSKSWPDNVPTDSDLPMLLEDMKYCNNRKITNNSDYCNRLRFRIASALLIQFDDSDQERGLQIIQQLAESGFPDAIVYYGMVLNEGRAGRDPDSAEAVKWFKLCADRYQHPQAQYELGVAYYTGEGAEEDEEEAVRLFTLAAGKSALVLLYLMYSCVQYEVFET